MIIIMVRNPEVQPCPSLKNKSALRLETNWEQEHQQANRGMGV